MPSPFIVSVFRGTLSLSERRDISLLAQEIRTEQPGFSLLPPFGPDVRIGYGGQRCVIFGDNGEIPLLLQRRHSRLDYRLGFLAGDGDIVVVGGQSSLPFEEYQQAISGVSGVRYLNVDPQEQPPLQATPAICLRQPQVFCRLAALLADDESPTLVAHITTGTIWALAAKLAAKLGRPVHVAGPPPRLSRAVNDKGWFGQMATRLLGKMAVPPKRIAYGPASLTRHVAQLAKRWDRLYLKVPNSAGSAGNYAITTEELRELRPQDLHSLLISFLSGSGWSGAYPLLVEVIDANVLCSPSAQLWIPTPDTGAPVIEGLFEQTLAGPANKFTGAVQAQLPPSVQKQLIHQAQMMGQLFQELGYFGRCSFDAVLAGSDWENAAIHWIECNGRWGGVSIPMSLVNHLDQGNQSGAYVIIQTPFTRSQPQSFSEFLAKVERHFVSAIQNKDIIFLSPNALEAGSGLHVLCRGKTRQGAMELSQQLIEFIEPR